MATWPPPFLQGLQAAAQPFFVQTPYGVCLYDPSTGVCSPQINPAAFTATNMPPHPQQQLAAPPAAPPPPPPAAAAQPLPPPPAAAAQPPPPPSLPPAIDVSIEQSTFSPSSDMVEALDAMSKLAWRFRSPPLAPVVSIEQLTFTPSSKMVEDLSAISKHLWQFRHDLRPMQVCTNGTLHEDDRCDDVILGSNRLCKAGQLGMSPRTPSLLVNRSCLVVCDRVHMHLPIITQQSIMDFF